MRYLVLIGVPNKIGCDRLGIIASKRLGGAVIRNRAKRRLREMFRQRNSRTTETVERTLDLVAIPRRELVSAPFEVVESEFTKALTRLRTARVT